MSDKHSVVCPECHHEFNLSDAGYADIMQQVRTKAFEREVEAVRHQMEREHSFEIEALRSKMRLESEQSRQDDARRILTLEREIALANEAHERELSMERERARAELALKDEQIEQYRDFKMRMSTKMVGESLERHCENAFNSIRACGFKDAYFEKDNDAKTGSKGDYIFRDSRGGVEYISIMFEMKNEMDETSTKHKNEDFLKELDKDRREKGCEYAVLVSMLEADNEFYNQGIVDMSHRYPKMYVIRPQFFIPMITILRNAALNSLEYREQLQRERMRNIDVMHFEESLDEFKSKFERNRDLADRKLEGAISDIDKAIATLQKARTELEACGRNIRLAGDKLDDLTVRRLVKGNPTMAALFGENR